MKRHSNQWCLEKQVHVSSLNKYDQYEWTVKGAWVSNICPPIKEQEHNKEQEKEEQEQEKQ